MGNLRLFIRIGIPVFYVCFFFIKKISVLKAFFFALLDNFMIQEIHISVYCLTL